MQTTSERIDSECFFNENKNIVIKLHASFDRVERIISNLTKGLLISKPNRCIETTYGFKVGKLQKVQMDEMR